MKPKLELTVSEMMQLRNDGYSNKDIARILDISLPTVYKYIGKQGCHIQSATASFIRKPVEEAPAPEFKVVSQVLSIDGFLFELSKLSSTVGINLADGQSITIPADDMDRLMDAMRIAKEYMTKEVQRW